MANVRLIRSDELEQLLALYAHLHQHDELPRSRDELVGMWCQIMSDTRSAIFVVAEGALLVASCYLVVVPNLTHSTRPFGVIENVVTHTTYRRRGLGSLVLRHALEGAWRRGCYKVMLQTGSKRPETLRFYEQNGFEREGRTAFVARPP